MTEPSSDQVQLEGPFTYLLSTTTTPRLEPEFIISPLLSRIPPASDDPPSMDLIIVRPLRDPRVQTQISDTQKQEIWKARAREILGWAYNQGGHVDLTYDEHEEAEKQGKGDVVVEIFRCGGFEWIPAVRLYDQVNDTELIMTRTRSTMLHTSSVPMDPSTIFPEAAKRRSRLWITEVVYGMPDSTFGGETST